MLSNVRDSLLRFYVGLPEHPTKYRVVRWLGRNVFPAKGIRKEIASGVTLLLHPRDWIEYLILRGQAYEPLTLEFIVQNLKPGDATVFAGVNFGLHIIAAAKVVGQSGIVVGIEPQPAALLRARLNLELNHLSSNVTLVNSALGAREQFVHMAWSCTDENAGAASLLDQGEGFTTCLIPFSKISEMVSPKAIRLFLLDVEGYEIEVLKGLGPEQLPQIMIVEVSPEILKRANVTQSDLFRAIQTLGYQIHSLHGDLVSASELDIPERNVVCIGAGCGMRWVDRCDNTK